MNFSRHHANYPSFSESEIEKKLNEIKNKIRYQAHQNYFKDVRAFYSNSETENDQRNVYQGDVIQNVKEQHYSRYQGSNDDESTRNPEDNLNLQNGESEFSWKDCKYDDRETFKNLNKLVGLYNTIHQGFFNYTEPEIIHILINRTIEEIEAKVFTLREIFQEQDNRILQSNSYEEGRIFMMILIFKELEQLLMNLSQNESNYRNRLLSITNECQILSAQIKSILGINTIKAISC